MPDMESLYGSDNPTATAQPPAKNPSEESDGESATGLLPKSVFPEPPKPGDVCSFDVVRVLEDQVMVKYHAEEGGESGEGGGMGEESAAPSPQSDMSEYMG